MTTGKKAYTEEQKLDDLWKKGGLSDCELTDRLEELDKLCDITAYPEEEEDLTSNDVFEIVHESYINGQLKQAIEQLDSAGESLPDFIEYVRDVSGSNEALDIALRLLKVRA